MPLNKLSFSMLIFTAILVSQTVLACNLQASDSQYKNYLNYQVRNQSCQEDCCGSLKARAPMVYYFYQNTGRFRGGSSEWAINTLGYSGSGAGYLNPDYQCKLGAVLPASTYTVAFCKNIMHQSTHRPCAFYLRPEKPEQVCGRDDFFIHGCRCCTADDDTQPPFPGCSAGCIVMHYKDRKKIRVGDTIIVQSYEPKIINQEQAQ